jgi:hypothetical protein
MTCCAQLCAPIHKSAAMRPLAEATRFRWDMTEGASAATAALTADGSRVAGLSAQGIAGSNP